MSNKKKIILTKIALCFSGLLLLAILGESMRPVVTLILCTALTYAWALQIESNENLNYRKLVSRSAVPMAIILIVILNMTGKIGTLTGTVDINDASFSILLAAPFYFLSASAFVTDVALRRARIPNFLDYLTYISLPFKLLAGPIENPKLITKIEKFSPRFNWWRFSAAWPWIAMGAVMKFVIANRLNPSANLNLSDPISTLITAAVFELKFYFDFAGYSFMGYGAALCVGIQINKNFSHPFFANNVINFWRRWHISLGRFLSRYVLEPNLSLFTKRSTKLIFASFIFFVSALWHGGTVNYIFWGFFHATVYYIYVKHFKRREINFWLGLISMIFFFVMGRFFAIDSNYSSILTKLVAFVEPFNFFKFSLHNFIEIKYNISSTEIKGVIAAILFLILEGISLKLYSLNRSYHLFRRPISALIMFLIFLFFGISSGNLLYARI
jgi:alginate O-acetyltransferase complex protein AlgI